MGLTSVGKKTLRRTIEMLERTKHDTKEYGIALSALKDLYDSVKRKAKFDNPDFEEIITSNMVVDPGTGCWLWTGGLDRHGYGRFGFGHKKWKAHRASWEVFVGKIPDDMYMLHKCDNPQCIRPQHLFLGTQMDNMRDMQQKGRSRYGGKKPEVKTSRLEAENG